jgi:hypothetical protein
LVEGPPYPTDFPFYEAEALALFADKTELSLPYSTNDNSASLIRQLYSAGSTNVIAVVTDATTAQPTVREIEILIPNSDVKTRVQRILEAVVEGAKAKGRMIQLSEGDTANSITVWWEDV